MQPQLPVPVPLYLFPALNKTCERIPLSLPVQSIVDQRMADTCHVYPDLMRPSRIQRALNQRIFSGTASHLVMRLCLFAAVADSHFQRMILDNSNPPCDLSGFGREISTDQRQIFFMKLPFFPLKRQTLGGDLILSRNHNPRCIAVQSPDNPDHTSTLPAPKISCQLVRKRIPVVSSRRMTNLSGWLLHCYEIFILIKNLQISLHLFNLNRILFLLQTDPD